MTPEIARATMVLLSRTDIKGGEAPMFMQILAALQQIADAEPTPSHMPRRVGGGANGVDTTP